MNKTPYTRKDGIVGYLNELDNRSQAELAKMEKAEKAVKETYKILKGWNPNK